MPHTEFDWPRDGIAFYGQAWEPDAPPQAVVALVHGLGEHSGRYAHVAAAFNQAGYALVAFDLRGHGKTTGQRGYTPSYEALMQDIDRFLAEVDQRFPGRPRFLYGHSLGGGLVLNYVLRHQPELAGVIATAAALRSPLEEQTLKVAMARLLSSLMPAMPMRSGLPVEGLSHNPQVIEAYVDDPLVHDLATPRLAVESFAAGRWALAHAAEFPAAPILLVHGGADAICYPAGTRDFAAQVPGECTLKLWEGLYHEVHNEPEQEEVLAYIVEWMNAHLPA